MRDVGVVAFQSNKHTTQLMNNLALDWELSFVPSIVDLDICLTKQIAKAIHNASTYKYIQLLLLM
jgi:hypothetical protein